MALTLDLTYSQSNDAVTLTVADAAGEYTVNNTAGWTTPNVTYADIVTSTDDTTASKYHLLLAVTVTDKDGTSTTYDTLNLYDETYGVGESDVYASASELTWDLTPADFISSGTAMGTTTDVLDDGIYVVTFSLVLNSDHSTAIATALSESVLINGEVLISVYNKLRQIPVDYDYETTDTSRDVMEALLCYSYLQSINASASVAMTEEITNMIYTLDKLVSDGSHYTW